MIITVDKLLPGRQYGIQLRARTAEGSSDWSKTFVVNVGSDTVAPKTPTGLTVTPVGSTFTISWNAVTQNADNTALTDLAYYEINITNQSTGTVNYTTSATKYDFSFEKNNAALGGPAGVINVKVRAVDKFGNASAYTSVVQGTNPAPAPPTNVTVSPLVDALSVSWTKAADPDIVEYQIYTGTSSTFTPSGTPVWRGNANNASVKYTDYSNATWVKVCSVDVFGTQSTFATSSSSSTPISSQNGSLGQRVYYATVAPTNQANNPGDTWFVRELATGTIIGQYEGAGGTSWNQRTLNSQVIANLDVGKLTSGVLNVATTITAGDPNAIRTQLTGTGLKSYSSVLAPLYVAATGFNVSGGSLAASTQYRWAVSTLTSAGETTPVYVIKTTGSGDNAMFIGWTAAAGATGYRVYRQAYPSGSWTQVYTSNDPTALSYMDNAGTSNSGTPLSTSTAGYILSLSTENGALYVAATLDGIHRTSASGPRMEMRSATPTGSELAKTSLLGYTGYVNESGPGDISMYAIGKDGMTKLSSPSMAGMASITLTGKGGPIDGGIPFPIYSNIRLNASEIYWPTGSHTYMEGQWYRNYNDWTNGYAPIGQWNSYTVTVSGASGFTVGTTGSPVLEGYWARVGNTVYVKGRFVFGNNGAAGSGAWSINLPLTVKDTIMTSSVWLSPAADGSIAVAGSASPLLATSANAFGVWAPQATNTVRMTRIGGGSGFNSPGGSTWSAGGGFMRWFMVYETDAA